MAPTAQRELVPRAAAVFKMSRQAVHRHLAEMVDEGLMIPHGKTRARHYELKTLDSIDHVAKLAGLDEHNVWREQLFRFFEPVPGRATQIAHTGFTEMLNNAIDHSEGTTVLVRAQRTAIDVRLGISDDGVGIFQKIKDALGLENTRQSVLELAKGKFTTDPANHTGMGILVTSLACDRFYLMSCGLAVTHNSRQGRNYLFEDVVFEGGTTVSMHILLDTPVTMASIYEQLATEDHPGFTRTVIPLQLAQMGDDNLVSRTQAKRVLERVDRFRNVIFDFEGVEEIGQAFADELYRVFRLNNPEVNVSTMNASPAIQMMIELANSAWRESSAARQV
jgi:anti-sigma regulatory factor (Ser/Thr protein kinase)